MAHTASCGHCVVASPSWAGYTSCGKESSEVSQAQASPYNIHPLGAPAASNEDIRAATAAAIDAARIPHDPEFGEHPSKLAIPLPEGMNKKERTTCIALKPG